MGELALALRPVGGHKGQPGLASVHAGVWHVRTLVSALRGGTAEAVAPGACSLDVHGPLVYAIALPETWIVVGAGKEVIASELVKDAVALSMSTSVVTSRHNPSHFLMARSPIKEANVTEHFSFPYALWQFARGTSHPIIIKLIEESLP